MSDKSIVLKAFNNHFFDFFDEIMKIKNEKYIFVNIITVLLFTYLFFILTYLICWNLKTKYFRKKFK